MSRPKTIWLGLICLFFLQGDVFVHSVKAERELSDVEVLLEQTEWSESGAGDLLLSLDAAVADSDRDDTAAAARITQLEQLLADRDAIIVQLSNAAPEGDIATLRQENESLTADLEAARQERDQIREDFNRLFEGGAVVPESRDEGAAEADDALRQRLHELEAQLAELTQALEKASEEDDAVDALVAADDVDADEWAQMQSDLSETRAVLESLRETLAISEAEREELEAAFEQQQAKLHEELLAARQSKEAAEHARAELESLLTEELRTVREEKEALRVALASSQQAQEDLQAALESPEVVADADSMRQQLEELQALDASRRVTMDELMLQAGNLREALATMEADNVALDEALRELQSRYENQGAVLAERNEVIDALQEEKSAHADVLAGAWAKIESQAKEMGEVRNAMRELQTNLQQRQEAYQALSQQYAEVNDQYLVAQETITRLEADIVSLREQASERDAEYQALRQELERTLLVDERRRRVLDETLVQVVEAEERGSALQADLEQKQSELASVTTARDEVRSAFAALQEEADALRARLATAEETLSDLRDNLAESRTDLSDKESDNAALVELIASLDEELSTLRSQQETKQAELAAARQQLAETSATIESLQSEKESIRLVDDRRRRTLDDTLTALALAEQQLQELQGWVETAEAQLHQSTEDMASLAARNAALEAERSEMETALEQARQLAAGLSEDGAVIDGRIAALEARNAELESSLQAATGEGSDGVSDERVALQAELEVSRNEVAELQALLQMDDSTASSRAAELEAELATVRSDFETMRAQLEAKEASLQGMQQELDSARLIDIRETDLYLELEADASLLRDKLVEAEAGRQRLQRTVEEMRAELEKMQARLRAVETEKESAEVNLVAFAEREGEYQELIERLMPEVRTLEETVTELRRERELMASRLLQQEEDVAALKVELEQREHRLARAERVAEVLERTRSEVEQAQRQQRLNMHFNMAAVYARDGRFAEAEYEYLQALRLDPSDADIHFNLAILYDDHLNQPDKATLHYRRYLQLNPHGEDADRVRSWLMRLEMDQRR